jgi:hypothetical protein
MSITLTDARAELADLLDRHDIAFEVRGADWPLTFGRGDDGRLAVIVPSGWNPPEVLAFACKVIAQEEEGRKLDAVMDVLLPFRDGDPHLAALAEAFIHSAAWHRGAAAQFVELIERGLATGGQENRA